MTRFRLSAVLLSVLVLVGSCVDGEGPSGPGDDGAAAVSLPLLARLAPAAAGAAAEPINRIRAVARRLPGREVLGSTVVDVSPTADAWDVAIEVEIAGPTRVEVTFELIHVDPETGAETVEFSGRETLSVTPGVDATPAEITVVRGPLENLDVTSVTITSAPALLAEGESAPLSADVVTTGSATPTVFWTAVDPAVLEVVGSTATGLLPGETQVVATAGAMADTATVTVVAVAASLVVVPDSSLVTVGQTVALAAVVLDPRGDTLPGQPALWRSLDPAFLTSLGGGTFDALAPGLARVEARAAADTLLKDTAVVAVVPSPGDLSVTKAASATSAAEGDTVEFTVTVRNGSVTEAAGVRVLDSLPAGLELVTATPGSGAFDPSTRTWEPGPLAAGATESLTLLARVAEGTAGRTLTNVARVIPPPGQLDTVAANDRATAGVVVGQATTNLLVVKTVDRSSASVGDTVVFTVELGNAGSRTPDGVLVVDTLPPGLALLDATTTGGTLDTLTGEWELASSPAPGAFERLYVTAVIEPGAAGLTLVNTARIDTVAGVRDPTVSDNQSSASVAVAGVAPTADVEVQVSVNDPAPAEGDTVEFTTLVQNNGPETATGVVVLDSLPPGLTLLGVILPPGATPGGPGRFQLDSLPAGSHEFAVQEAVVDAGSGGQTLVKAAVVEAVDQVDPDATNDTASVAVGVLAPAALDLGVEKSTTSSAPAVGDTVDYTIRVINVSSANALAANVRDSLGPGLNFVDASPSVGAFDPGTGTWSLGALAGGDTATMTLRAEVDSSAAGTTVFNEARLDSSNPADANPANDEAVVGLTVASGTPAFSISHSIPFGVVETDTTTWTVEVVNTSAVDASSVVVKDSLGPQQTFVAAVPSSGTFDPGTRLWSIGAMAAGDTATLLIDVVVNDGVGGSSITLYSALDSSVPPGTGGPTSTAHGILKRSLDVGVAKSVDDPSPAVGDPATWTVEVVNHGPDSATDVVVQDSLPSVLVVDSFSVSAGSVVGDTLWTIPTLAEGDTAVWRIHTTVAAVGGDTVTNAVAVQSLFQNDTDGSNDFDQVTVVVPVGTPPVVTITAPPADTVVDPGDTVSFAATATDVQDGDLTASIQWTSDVDGFLAAGPSFSTFNLSPGPHLVAATVTDSDGDVGADTVPITVAIVSVSPTLNVPFGGTASLPISLSAPAPAGGLQVTVSSTDPSITAPVQSSLLIPGGALSANAQLQGVAPGATTVTVSSAGFGSDSSAVSVTASLSISQSSVAFPEGFGQAVDIVLQSQGSAISAPAGGLQVTLASADPGCVAAPSSVTIPAGQVSTSAALSYGGQTATQCQSTVVATAPQIAPDSVQVTVNPPPAFFSFVAPVGADLMRFSSASLGYGLHGGTTVTVKSLAPASLQLAPDAVTPGSDSILVPLNNGQTSVSFLVHGLVADTPDVVISAPGFVPDTLSIPVLQPALQLVGVNPATTTATGEDPFAVRVGVPSGQGVAGQQVRVGAGPLTATLTNDTASVARLVTATDTGQVVTVQIAEGQNQSPGSVATGGAALDPTGAGVTTVSASIPGFLQQPLATQAVTVTAPSLSLFTGAVGARLQRSSSVSLGASAHGGVTLTVESLDTALLVAPDGSTPGTSSIDIDVPDGTSSAGFYVQGLEGTIDTVALAVTAPGFNPDTVQVPILPSGLQIIGLNTNTTTLSPENPFYVRTGVVSSAGNALQFVQSLRWGAGSLTVTVTSDTAAVARLVTVPDTGASVQLTIPEGGSNTPTAVSFGGAALEPLSAGTTVVSAAAPGFANVNPTTVTVTAPTTSQSAGTVGAGLQRSVFGGLGASAHGGVTVGVKSLNPQVLQVSPDQATPGSDSVGVFVPDGSSGFSYYIQGVEGVLNDTVRVVLSAPGFVPDTSAVPVVQPGIVLLGLTPSTTTLSASDPFSLRVGIPSGSGVFSQQVRAGGDTVFATVTSSKTAVGVIDGGSSSGGSVGARIVPGSFQQAGTLAFDPQGPGVTTVAVTAPGYAQPGQSSQDVTVNSPAVTINSVTVGSGLQRATNVALGASSHGGVNVVIKSSSPAVGLVGPDGSTAATDSIVLFFADGQTVRSLWVAGVEGQTGSINLNASAPGFTDGNATLTVAQPAVMIVGLNTSQTAGGTQDDFQVRVGLPLNTTVNAQQVRAGASPLVATVTSSDPQAGQLVTSSASGGSVTVEIPAGQFQSATSPALGGVALEPLVAGSTQVEASIPSFIQVTTAVVAVTIN